MSRIVRIPDWLEVLMEQNRRGFETPVQVIARVFLELQDAVQIPVGQGHKVAQDKNCRALGELSMFLMYGNQDHIATTKNMYAYVQANCHLTEDDLWATPKWGKNSKVFHHRLRAGLNRLAFEGLVISLGRGRWQLTAAGVDYLKAIMEINS